MPESKVQGQLADVARWCIAQQKGILTASGKPKKPPTYWIVACSACGIGLTSSSEVTYKSVKDDKVKCKKRVKNEVTYTRQNWTSGGAKSRVCGRAVNVIEEITE